MKKVKKLLLTSLVAVTAFCGAACSNKKNTANEANEFAVIGATDEESGVRLNATEDITDNKTVTNTGTKVSRVVAQVGEASDVDGTSITPLRFVAAVKATFGEDGKAVLTAGEFGFHVAYNNGSAVDKYYAVDKVKLSVATTIGDATTFYASNYSTYEAKDGETKKSMADFCTAAGIQDADYTAFIAVEMQVPTASVDTLVAVEAYSSDGENYDLSSQTKKANATGHASYFATVDGENFTSMTFADKGTYTQYSFTGSLNTGDVVTVYNSYGEKETNSMENLTGCADANGDFVVPFNATYSFYYKQDQDRTYITINDLPTNVVFLEPGCWDVSNAKYGLYLYGNDASNNKVETWVAMNSLSDSIYYVFLPSDSVYTTMIYVRLKDSTLSWSGEWNQSQDLTIGEHNYAVPYSDNWNYVNYKTVTSI